MVTLRVRLLGGFTVEANGRHVAPEAWHLRKAAGIVKLLAVAPHHRLHREQLIDRLWPDLDPAAAAGQLRKALHGARRALDGDPSATDRYITRVGDMVALAPDVQVDVAAFERAATRARRTRDISAYDEAIALYTGDLLPEDRYDGWVTELAEPLREEHLALLVEATGLLEARGELDAAVAAARRALTVDPLCEPAHVALMRIYVLAGRRAEALAQYARLRRTLRTELGAEPEIRIQRLYEQIRAGRQLEPDLAADVWEQIGDLRTLNGDALGAAAAYEAGLSTGPHDRQTERLARLHRKAAQAHLMHSDTAPAEPHIAAATRLVTGTDDAIERLRVLDARATWLWQTGDLEQARNVAERNLTLAEQVGSSDAVAAADETLAIVYHCQGAWQEGLHIEIERLGAGAQGGTQLARVFDIHHCIGQYHLYGDALCDNVEDYARRTLALAERVGAVRAEAFAWCLLGETMLLRGGWDEAAACLERSAQIQDRLGVGACGLVWQRLAELAVERDDSEAVAAYVRRGMAIATVSPMSRHVWGRLYATVAFDAVERGDSVAAVRAIRTAAAAAARYGDCLTCSALLNPVAAEAYAALGDVAEAEVHVRAAEQVAGSFQSSAWRAMAETARGALELARQDGPHAREHFLAAARLYSQAGQPFWTARATEQAGTALGVGHVDQAMLREAESTFERLGALRAARRANAMS